MNSTLLTRSTALEIEQVLEVLSTCVTPDILARVTKLLRDAQRPTTTWQRLERGRFIIDGEQVVSPLRGLEAAYLAFLNANHGGVVRVADLVKIDSRLTRASADSVRNSLRKAASFLQPSNPRAAAAIRSIKVTRDYVVYAPDGLRDVITT